MKKKENNIKSFILLGTLIFLIIIICSIKSIYADNISAAKLNIGDDFTLIEGFQRGNGDFRKFILH